MPWPALFFYRAWVGPWHRKPLDPKELFQVFLAFLFPGPGTLMAWWLHRQRSLSPDAILGHPEETSFNTSPSHSHGGASLEIQPIADVFERPGLGFEEGGHPPAVASRVTGSASGCLNRPC